MDIAILLYDRFTALDAVGPYEVLSRLPGATVTFVAEQPGPQRSDTGSLTLLAEAPLSEHAHPEIVLVPGGPGQAALMQDGPVHAWLRGADETSTWTASVCTGSLILAAAGLLEGRRATSHWLALEELGRLGAKPTAERVVFDGKIVTARACRRASTWRWRWRRGSPARRSHRQSSWGSSMTRSRRSTRARPQRRPPRSSSALRARARFA